MADSFYGKLFSSTKEQTEFTVGDYNIDLTPAIYKEAKKARLTKYRWIVFNAALAILCLGGAVFYYFSGTSAKIELETAKKNSSALETQLAKFEEVNMAVDQKAGILQKLNQASGGEVNWSSLLGSIQSMLPEGTGLESVAVNVDGASTERSTSILLKFISNSPLGYADTLKAVESANGVSNVRIGGMTSSGENSYSYSATLDYDNSVKTNRFAIDNGGN